MILNKASDIKCLQLSIRVFSSYILSFLSLYFHNFIFSSQGNIFFLIQNQTFKIIFKYIYIWFLLFPPNYKCAYFYEI